MKLSPHTRLTLPELMAEQNSASTHLTFSLTRACPLKCEHCIVNAGPELGHTTMPLEVAKWYAGQMAGLYEHGIRMLSFTGGEPLLARKQLRVMSDAAQAAGIVCGVVTAAHWANTAARAQAVVRQFPGLDLWDVSLDAYHKEFVAYEYARTAYQAAKACGRRAVIRLAHHDPLTPEDQEAVDFIDTFADPADVCAQRIRSVGRATNQPVEESKDQRTFVKPCMTKGLVVRYDGSTAPCCINLVEDRRHPFQFGDTRSRPLADIHADYLAHPLLQMIRAIGFADVVAWLKDAGMGHLLPETMPEDVCDLCPRIMTDKVATALLTELCARPQARLKIAVLADRVLGEPQMLRRTVEELKGDSQSLEGFALAEKLATRTTTKANAGEADARAT